jgi:hypothetical protein
MKEWEQFESAVATLVAGLDPKAEVRQNVKLPDRDTGRPRQRDVWVKATICKIFPVCMLISCKRLRRKLNELDVDAFIGELASSGAHKGVLYTYTGYTEHALKKAAAHGISCCKLYQNKPPDVPDALFFSFYCCASSFYLRVNDEALEIWGDELIEDVLSVVDSSGQTAFDQLIRAFWEAQEAKVQEALNAHAFPGSWATAIKLQSSSTLNQPELVLSLHGMWRFYRAKLCGHMINGTYSFTEGNFIGSQSSPSVDMVGPEPGPGWERVVDVPARLEPGIAIFILKGGGIKELVLEHFWGKRLRELVSKRFGPNTEPCI